MNEKEKEQLRQERQCAGIFEELAIELALCDCHGEVMLIRDYDFTLLTFSLEPGYGAFATTLPTGAFLVDAFESLLARWEDRQAALQRLGEFGDRHLISADALQAAGEFVRKRIPSKDGFGLLIGKTPYTRWIARGERSDMMKFIRDELIPSWKERMS